jgi:anti-sigma factor RsiW
MKCKSVRSVLFDYRDGSLSADEQERIENHLTACSSCREMLEAEAGIASKYRACFEERRRAFPFQAEALAASLNKLPLDHRVPLAQRKRFMKVLVPISVGAALVFVAILIFRPARLRTDDYAPRASSRAGDLPDPFRDWIEKRMIITIEDKKAGTFERIEADRHGIIARSVETRGNR